MVIPWRPRTASNPLQIKCILTFDALTWILNSVLPSNVSPNFIYYGSGIPRIYICAAFLPYFVKTTPTGKKKKKTLVTMVHMEAKKKAMGVQVQALLLIMLVVVASPTLGCTPSDGRGCKDCIVSQMRNACPSCMPILHCMAWCLWGGSPRPNCIKKCDCNNGYPTLSDCKRCMSKCKCSCLN